MLKLYQTKTLCPAPLVEVLGTQACSGSSQHHPLLHRSRLDRASYYHYVFLSDIAWTPCPVAGRICRVERRGVDPANMRSVLNIVMDAADAP